MGNLGRKESRIVAAIANFLRTHRPLLTTACGLAVLACTSALRATPPQVFLLDAEHLARTREQLRNGNTRLAPALAELKRDAKTALTAGPFSVVHKTATPPSGDKHDYMTYAPYWWPDPTQPDRLPYIRRDGEHNPDILQISDRTELDELVNSVETLALAHYFTGDEKFARRARTLLRAWFIEPATRMNPNFEYAQAIRGRDTGRGLGLIESQSYAKLIDAVGLLAESKAWTADDDRALHEWFEQFLHWMLDTAKGHVEDRQKNNHGTYYDVQVASYALYLGKPELARKVLEAARSKRIAVQIEPDGRQPLELVRTNAWSYSIGNLSGLMKLAALGQHVGVDLWRYQTEDGRSISAAVEYLAPFGLDQKKWPYQQISGFSPESVYPLLRRAEAKYPEISFRAQLSKLPPIDPTNRDNLLFAG